MAPMKGVLILSPFFSPNIGGTENQLDDLVQELDRYNFSVYVHTYSPLTTNISWKSYETRGHNIKIWRYRWFGNDLFHKVEKFPLIDFLYLTPYLFLRTFTWMLLNHRLIDTIHAQGLNASLIGIILKYIFRKRLITSIHAVYEINPQTFIAKLNGKIINQSDKVLATSDRSLAELSSFGVNKKKLDVFIPWIDTEIFVPLNKQVCRKYFKLQDKFTVIFLSRLIEKKGDRILLKAASQLPNINFVFAGVGPEEEYIKDFASKHKNITFLGKINYSDLPKYYNCADIYCFPTQYEEGFGKVLAESLACGTPVITSDKGAIPKVVNNTVAVLIPPTTENFVKAIRRLYDHPPDLQKLKKNSVAYAIKHFGPQNAKLIYRYY